MAVVAIADLYGISGRRDELVALLAEAEREAAAQSGCIRYSFAATLADPDRFVLVSEWRDQAAMDAHYGSRPFASFQLRDSGTRQARPTRLKLIVDAGPLCAAAATRDRNHRRTT